MFHEIFTSEPGDPPMTLEIPIQLFPMSHEAHPYPRSEKNREGTVGLCWGDGRHHGGERIATQRLLK